MMKTEVVVQCESEDAMRTPSRPSATCHVIMMTAKLATRHVALHCIKVTVHYMTDQITAAISESVRAA